MQYLNIHTKVAKVTLLNTLYGNRARHAELYIDARAGYISKAKDMLQSMLGELEAGKAPVLRFTLPVPEYHTADYTTVIRMLEMSVEEQIVLTGDEFRVYVEDRWDWMQSWLVSNASYSAATVAYLDTVSGGNG